MDDLKKFSQAILNGISGAQNGPGVAGISENANRAFASRLRAPLVERGAGVGALAGQVADNEEAARKAEQARKLKELEDMVDPSKYERRRKEDGGFAFFDPTGKEIGIDTYAKRTGMRPAEILKDSDNPLDRQFVSDYNNMNELMQAAFNGDNDTVNSILEENGLDKGAKPESYMQELVRKYPHIYGAGAYSQSRQNLNKPVFKIKPQAGSNYGVTLPSSFGG